MLADTILIIDDEPQIRRVVKNALANEVSTVLEASDGAEGLAVATAERPTLVVLDLGLPDMAGIDVCRSLRSWSAAPIVVLSARHSDHEKASLLDSGADDYITKPFSNVEFAARIRANLRRAQASQIAASVQPMQIGSLVADFTARVLRRGPRRFTSRRSSGSFSAPSPRRRGARSRISRSSTRCGDARSAIRSSISACTSPICVRKIETDPVRPQLIVTEPGVGYRFELPR